MYYYQTYLYHHGIKGQKWGVRRFQNKDGSLTPKGEKRYEVGDNGKMSEKGKRRFNIDSNKTAYKQAKANLKEANRAYLDSKYGKLGGEKTGLAAIAAQKKAFANARKAELDLIDAKIGLKKSKIKNSEKADKYELNKYTKEMNKAGLAGSRADYLMRGRSSDLQKRIQTKKGKQYANKIVENLEKKYTRGKNVTEVASALGSTQAFAVGRAYIDKMSF